MSEQQNQNEAACGGSALTAELGNEIERHLRQLAPHQREREAARLLRASKAEIDRLRDGLQRMVSLYESEQDHENPSALRPEWLKALLVPNA